MLRIENKTHFIMFESTNQMFNPFVADFILPQV